jgi:phospholipid transport system substrate-binding protein
MSMRLLALVLSFVAATLFAPLLQAQQAQQLGPEELVKKVTSDVLETIKSDKQLAAGDKRKALQLAEQKILPHVDFQEATQLAVGKAWNQASPEQKEQLVTSFRTMLVKIYSNAIDVYRGQTMRTLPVRVPPTATEATVRNQYIKDGQPPVPVEYAMKKTGEGWKIYDISVEGVSLVQTYRAEFDNITRTQGVEGLIKKLKERTA